MNQLTIQNGTLYHIQEIPNILFFPKVKHISTKQDSNIQKRLFMFISIKKNPLLARASLSNPSPSVSTSVSTSVSPAASPSSVSTSNPVHAF